MNIYMAGHLSDKESMMMMTVVIFLIIFVGVNIRAFIRMIVKKKLIREIQYLANDMETGENDISNKDLKYFDQEKLKEIIAELKELPMGKRSLNIVLKTLEEEEEALETGVSRDAISDSGMRSNK